MLKLADPPEPDLITTVEELNSLYDDPQDGAIRKQTDHIVGPGRAIIASSPFILFVTASDIGVDCSPKGDEPGFVQVLDDRTILIPDRPGNNRLDGLRNIIANPKVGIIFMVPGVNITYRINGTAKISTAPDLLDRFLVRSKRPRSVIVVNVEEAYPHCPKAFVRSDLWASGAKPVPDGVPNSGTFVAYREGRDQAFAKEYEADYQSRLKERLY